MMPTVRVDDLAFGRGMKELARVTGIEVVDLVRGQARLLANTAMVIQQPYGKGLKQKRFIEGAIERGFRRAIKPIYASGEGGGKNEWHAPSLQKHIKDKNRLAMEHALRAMGGRTSGAQVVNFDKSIHKNNRWKKKLPGALQRVYTLDTNAWKQRLDELKKRAGYVKAGFAKAYLALGGRSVPAWIRRHLSYARGSVDAMQLISPKPSVTFGATVPHDDEVRIQFERAIDRRERQMVRHVKNIMAGHSFDFKNGVVRVWKPKPEREDG